MFLYKDGEKVIKRSYSIATTHSEYLQNKTIGFIVKYVSEGFMSNYFFSKAKPGDEIEIIWPLGHMILPENPWNKNFILISTGSGLSPIYGIFKRLIELDQYSSIIHLYGEKTQERLLWETIQLLTLEKWWINNNLCFSRESESAYHNYFHWYVWHCLTNIFEQWNIHWESICYLCGRPEIVDKLTQQLLSYGIPKENIKSEKY